MLKVKVIIIIRDNFCIALFSDVHKLTATFSDLSEKNKIESNIFKKVMHIKLLIIVNHLTMVESG